METRQLEHEGFEHTDEFRIPCSGEYYQTDIGQAVRCGVASPLMHGGKRWILRKKEEKPTVITGLNNFLCPCCNSTLRILDGTLRIGSAK